MDDLISRQAAIDAFNTNVDELVVAGKENADSVEKYLNRVLDKIKQLPPIQPKRGKWIKISPANIYECSECGKSVMTNDICAYDFCHGCGADMREVTE